MPRPNIDTPMIKSPQPHAMFPCFDELLMPVLKRLRVLPSGEDVSKQSRSRARNGLITSSHALSMIWWSQAENHERRYVSSDTRVLRVP